MGGQRPKIRGNWLALICSAVYITQKTILPAFHHFLFHRDILYTFKVIALLLTAYMHQSSVNFWSFFASFSPDIQHNTTFFTETIYSFWFLFFEKPKKTAQSSHMRLKNAENSKNDQILRKFGILRQIWVNQLGWLFWKCILIKMYLLAFIYFM